MISFCLWLPLPISGASSHLCTVGHLGSSTGSNHKYTRADLKYFCPKNRRPRKETDLQKTTYYCSIWHVENWYPKEPKFSCWVQFWTQDMQTSEASAMLVSKIRTVCFGTKGSNVMATWLVSWEYQRFEAISNHPANICRHSWILSLRAHV